MFSYKIYARKCAAASLPDITEFYDSIRHIIDVVDTMIWVTTMLLSRIAKLPGSRSVVAQSESIVLCE